MSLVYDSNKESFKKFEIVSDQLLKDLTIINPDLDLKKIKSNIILKLFN